MFIVIIFWYVTQSTQCYNDWKSFVLLNLLSAYYVLESKRLNEYKIPVLRAYSLVGGRQTVNKCIKYGVCQLVICALGKRI